jgi:hypothetical protein
MNTNKPSIELGWSKLKRESHIKTLLAHWKKSEKRNIRKLPFQGKEREFSEISVPLELPKYRIANRRLRADQIDYQLTNKLPKDIFDEKNEENLKTQRHQHQLLKEVIGTGEANLENFFKNNEQNLPFILTSSGIIVNGNRRICALRELLQKNAKKYSSKKMIDVLVLPPCQSKDIDELERYLQYSPNIHQDYTWYAKAYSFAKDSKFYKDTIERDPKQKTAIDSEIQSFKFGEKYLQFIKSPKKYKYLGVQEQACRTWIEVRTKYRGSNREYINYVESRIFQAMQNPKGGRVYEFIRKLINIENVKAAIRMSAKRYRIKEPKTEQGLINTSKVIQDRISKLSKEDSSNDIEQHKEELNEACDNHKLKKENSLVLKLVDKSLGNLHDALSVKNSKSSTKGLRAKLEAINKAVVDLIKWLK